MDKKNHQNNNYSKGCTAEILALNFLIQKGYLFVARRYKTNFGEIDLIMKSKKDEYVFCEVKQRKNLKTLFYSISRNQKNRILNASLIFTQKENIINPKMRFDVVFVYPEKGLFSIYHIENCWSG